MLGQALRVDSAAAVHEAPAKVALLGSGTVGLAVLQRLGEWRGTHLGRRLNLVFAANTRLSLFDPDGLDPQRCAAALAQAPRREQRARSSDVLAALGDEGVRILIDATADAEVAAKHPSLFSPG